MTDVALPAGTLVTCEEGHLIARVKTDIASLELIRVELLEWYVEEPPPWHPLPLRCPLCAAFYMTGTVNGVTLHTPHGWKPHERVTL